VIFPTTPSQTVGPFFGIGLPWDGGPYAAAEGTSGLIRISGIVYDGAGTPVEDNLIETWQADPEGCFADLWEQGGGSKLDGFRGFARSGYEEGDGGYEIFTVKPGEVQAPPTMGGASLAPHVDVSVFARGMLQRVVTRLYFADETEANAADPILATVPVERRETLLAQPSDDGYRFDIRLQGPEETVFFAV
jgi:protocatechuate 3,4-dioxygenase, alpha subunit